jgi:uncharacterized membrane protein (UPF0127 family)
VEVTVGDIPLDVWVADDDGERGQGMIGVDVMPDSVDGMLFVFEEPGQRFFHMAGVSIPLDIWWFDAEGRLVGSTPMEPCPRAPCPSYPSPDGVAWALETPSGSQDLPIGAMLST